MPFAAIRPMCVGVDRVGGGVLLAYLTGLNLNDLTMDPFGHPPWVRPVEYGPDRRRHRLPVRWRGRRVRAETGGGATGG